MEMMMNSRLFREELERIIETQMKDGSGPSGLLQQISEMMGPQGARFNANVFRSEYSIIYERSIAIFFRVFIPQYVQFIISQIGLLTDCLITLFRLKLRRSDKRHTRS